MREHTRERCPVILKPMNWRFTYKGCGDWWWSPGIFLQAQNRLYKPDMLNAQTGQTNT